MRSELEAATSSTSRRACALTCCQFISLYSPRSHSIDSTHGSLTAAIRPGITATVPLNPSNDPTVENGVRWQSLSGIPGCFRNAGTRLPYCALRSMSLGHLAGRASVTFPQPAQTVCHPHEHNGSRRLTQSEIDELVSFSPTSTHEIIVCFTWSGEAAHALYADCKALRGREVKFGGAKNEAADGKARMRVNGHTTRTQRPIATSFYAGKRGYY